jgi:type I restriction enzyme, S subunit
VGLKPGYKQTEVGVIPCDWEIRRIRDVCTLVNGRGFKPHEWGKSGLPIIRIQNLNGGDDFNHYAGRYDPKILVDHGQLLFAWSGSRGTSFGPHVWGGGRSLLNYHTWKVAVTESEATPHFLFHALQHLTGYVEDKAHGASALVHTQKWEMEQFPVLVPPIPEQHAIAAALGAVDALLSVLTRLIAKKRDLQQAAIQQLVTGRVRLPGFKGDWGMQRLGQVVLDGPKNGYSGRASPGALGTLTLRLTATTSGYMILDETTVKRLDKRIEPGSDLFLQRGDLLIQRSNTPELVGTAAVFDGPSETYIYPDLMMRLRFRDESIARWTWRYANSQAGRRFFLSAAAGSTGSMPKVGGGIIRKMLVPFPTKAERAAIITVLSDMDNEVAALEARLAKTRALKQGMMQELLTGRTRLV